MDEINLKTETEITDEYILYTHNYLKDKISYALKIVKQYILDNQLLIVGGTAIDYALKKQNDTLYNDLYQIPDFDIISPNNVQHANNIGKILCELKYENISIIPAIHQTTVRVQLLGFTLFDSTYIPENIYSKIPFLEYENFKFVHPNFQKINQYISLSFLYKYTGISYNILHRFKKDVQRLQLLENYYKLPSVDMINKLEVTKFNFDYTNIKFININIIHNDETLSYTSLPNKYFNRYNIHNDIIYNLETNIIFHGELAYNIIYVEFDRIYKKLKDILSFTKDEKIKLKELYENIKIKNTYSINSENIISFELFNISSVSFINANGNASDHNIENVFKLLKTKYKIKNKKYLNKILDLLPEQLYSELDQYELNIYNLYGNLVNINLLYNSKLDNYIPVTSYTYNLMYFLLQYYLEDDADIKNKYMLYYNSLNSIINIIQYMYNLYPVEFNNSENFDNSIFNYSLNTTGKKNYPDSYLQFIKNFKNLIANNKNLDNLPPKNYISYPNCEIKNLFDKNKSEYYSDIQSELTEIGISGISLNY